MQWTAVEMRCVHNISSGFGSMGGGGRTRREAVLLALEDIEGDEGRATSTFNDDLGARGNRGSRSNCLSMSSGGL